MYLLTYFWCHYKRYSQNFVANAMIWGGSMALWEKPIPASMATIIIGGVGLPETHFLFWPWLSFVLFDVKLYEDHHYMMPR